MELYYRKEGRYRNFQKPVNTHKLSEGIVIPMVVIRSTSVPQTNNKNDGTLLIRIHPRAIAIVLLLRATISVR